MKRPAGVTASAVVLALISLAQVPIGLCMALDAILLRDRSLFAAQPQATAAAPMPEWMTAIFYAFAALFLALAAWGIFTTVGLVRLRQWARYSVLVIGAGLAFVGLISLLSMLVLLLIPLPTSAGLDLAQAQRVQNIVRVVVAIIALLHAAILATGIWWLVYFNRKAVRAAFAGAEGAGAKSRRPFPIALIAGLLLLGALDYAVLAFLPLPSILFGWTLTGWGKAAYLLTFAVLHAAAAVGLWRLEEWARRLTLGLMAFGVVHSGVYFILPSLMLHAAAEINKSLHITQPAMAPGFSKAIYMESSGMTMVFLLAIAAALQMYRGRFAHPTEAPPAEPTELQ